MELRDLGATGPTLSAIGLGCNSFGMKLSQDEAIEVVRTAVEAGITHFDTAEKYGGGVSETVLGRALAGDRAAVTIATKFSPRPPGEFRSGDLARRVIEGCEGSLRRLGTSHIDLYYQHFPDLEAPLEELVGALGTLVSTGKVGHVAISNPDVRYLGLVGEIAAPVSFCGFQTEWSLLARGAEDGLVPAARSLGWGIVPYFPLASGLLTGKYRRGERYPEGSRLATLSWSERVATEANFVRVERLEAFAQDRGRTLLELALGWLLSQSTVASVIAGATSAGQVRDNVAASGWRLAPDELRAVDALLALPEASTAGVND